MAYLQCMPNWESAALTAATLLARAAASHVAAACIMNPLWGGGCDLAFWANPRQQATNRDTDAPPFLSFAIDRQIENIPERSEPSSQDPTTISPSAAM